jgi:hypothetical protein
MKLPRMIERPVTHIGMLQPGNIIRHVNGHEAYIVQANYGDHAIAVRVQYVSNPREWLVVEPEPASAESDGSKE